MTRRRSSDRFFGFCAGVHAAGDQLVVLSIIGEPNRFNPAAYLTRLTDYRRDSG